jgi:hypothetical protein
MRDFEETEINIGETVGRNVGKLSRKLSSDNAKVLIRVYKSLIGKQVKKAFILEHKDNLEFLMLLNAHFQMKKRKSSLK